MKCNQENCQNEAAWRFTWPGKDEAGICEAHVQALRNISMAMGLYLQILPIDTTPAHSE